MLLVFCLCLGINRGIISHYGMTLTRHTAKKSLMDLGYGLFRISQYYNSLVISVSTWYSHQQRSHDAFLCICTMLF